MEGVRDPNPPYTGDAVKKSIASPRLHARLLSCGPWEHKMWILASPERRLRRQGFFCAMRMSYKRTIWKYVFPQSLFPGAPKVSENVTSNDVPFLRAQHIDRLRSA